ncbi:MAG: HlyD family efflux transporter periplasmic adaptor subunit [Rhodobacterales bacterium]|nr:HlyD family efflux transporter periplasmic adaptor subunit [Rhodobacterales bacterium]MDX5412078.1 HlyD family efflux transporter periplasmic adaptor subunit [Rhodobacterales bacterium]
MSAPSQHPEQKWAPAPSTADTFAPEVVELEARPLPRTVKVMLVSLFVFLVAALSWTVLAPLDRVIETEASVVASNPRQMIRSLEPAVLEKMHFRVGETFGKGDILVEFSRDLAQSELDRLTVTVTALRHERDRLVAEQGMDLMTAATVAPPEGATWIGTLQEEIFRLRMAELAARFAADAIRINDLLQTKDNLINRLALLDRQIALNRVELDLRSRSAAAGNTTRDLILELENRLLSLESDRARLEGERAQADLRITLIETEQSVFLANFTLSARERLEVVSRQLSESSELLRQAAYRGARNNIAASFDGVVLEALDRAQGSTVQPNDVLMIAAPFSGESDLEIEATILPRDVGWVAVGMDTRIKLTALPSSRHGYLVGRVISISTDMVQGTGRTLQTPGAMARVPGPRAVIAITENRLRNLPEGFVLLPGMLARAEILIGQRSPYEYFLDPLLDGIDRALNEPN